MNQTELMILIVCLVVFMFGMSLVFIQNAKVKFKKLKSKSDAKSDSNKEEKKSKTKHLRPVVLTPKPAPEKEPEQETKVDITSKARNAENTENISFEADMDNDIISIDELKTFVDERPKSQPYRTISMPPSNGPMQVYDGLPEDFKDDVLPGDEVFGKPVAINPRNPQVPPPPPSEFMSGRGNDKKLYEELKTMSPEMKKIIIADILKRRDNH